MKRIAVLVVSWLTFLVITGAAPARAAEPECYTHPEFPDQCLTLASYNHILVLYDYIGRLQQRESQLEEKRVDLTYQVWALTDEVTGLRADLAEATQQRTNALLLAQRRRERILVLRARVQDLRWIIVRG